LILDDKVENTNKNLSGRTILILLACVVLTHYFLLMLSVFSQANVYSIPYWVRRGAQLEYASEAIINDILFYSFDVATIPEELIKAPGAKMYGGNSSMVSILFEEPVYAHLSITIKDVNNSTGVFEVILRIGPYSSKKDLYVGLLTSHVDGWYTLRANDDMDSTMWLRG